MLSRLAPSQIIAGCSCLLSLASCTTITTFGSSDETGGEGESSGGLLSSASGQSAGDPSSSSSSSSSTTTDASSSEGSDDSEADGGSFISDSDDPICAEDLPDGVLGHCSPVECSVILQDCAGGYTCRPVSVDGVSWNFSRCVPLDPDPVQLGEACAAVSSPFGGIDNCDDGLMCWEIDPQTLQGTCIEFCSGTLEEPVCVNPDDVCGISDRGNLAFCLPGCDPLLNDCGIQEACVPVSGDSFACIARQDAACPSGLVDVEPEAISGCTDGEPCCTPYCDTSDEAACDRGLQCVPYFDEPNPDHPTLGVCTGAER